MITPFTNKEFCTSSQDESKSCTHDIIYGGHTPNWNHSASVSNTIMVKQGVLCPTASEEMHNHPACECAPESMQGERSISQDEQLYRCALLLSTGMLEVKEVKEVKGSLGRRVFDRIIKWKWTLLTQAMRLKCTDLLYS